MQATASAASDLLKGILSRETNVSVAVNELRTVFRYMFSVALYGNEKELTSTSLAAPIYVGEAPKVSVPVSIPVLQPVDAPTAAPLVAGVAMEMEATEEAAEATLTEPVCTSTDSVPEIVPEAAPKTSANSPAPTPTTAVTVHRRRII